MTNSNGSSIPFNPFIHEWLLRQQEFLQQLLSAMQTNVNNEELGNLVGRVAAHYKQYYEYKLGVAREDVFRMFAPPWFSPYERTFLWIAGFRPGILFGLVTKSIGDDLSEEQKEKMEVLKMKTKVAEVELSSEMAKVQESIAGPELVRGQIVEDVETGQVEGVLESMKDALRNLMGNADYLRATTVMEVLKILTPVQSVKFLTAAAQFQLKVRQWGLLMLEE